MGASKLAVDFTNVKEGGNFSKKHMPSGDYLAKVTKVEDAKPKSEDDNTPMWLFTIQLKNTPSASYPYYCKLQENQLWKVRNLLVAAGINVPKKRMAVDPNKLVGKLIAVSLDDTEYNGKMQSEIGSVFSPAELEGSEVDDDEDVADVEDDEDEAPPAPKKKKAKAPEPEEEEDDEEDEAEADEFESMTRAQLKAYNAENELGIAVKKSMDDDALREAVRAAAAATAPDDEEEDEEEEPAPAPKKKSKKAAKPAADEDEDEIDIEDL